MKDCFEDLFWGLFVFILIFGGGVLGWIVGSEMHRVMAR